MTDADVLWFDDAGELRAWIAVHAGRETEAWLGFHRAAYGTGAAALGFEDAADELATAGWADGERRLVDSTRYAVRFAPGKVTRAPVTPMPARPWTGTDVPALDPAYEERFKAEPAAWEFFTAQQPGYRRIATWWVMSGKAEQTRERRLVALIEGSAAGQRLPQLMRIR